MATSRRSEKAQFPDLTSGIALSSRFSSVTVNGRELHTTPVFDSYWRFAAARQQIYLARLDGSPPPWSGDPILRDHRFTNAFRAADRVSQYLIRSVIYDESGASSPEDVVFRILLFKFFNKIETWEGLKAELTEISWATFEFEAYRRELETLSLRGPIYSPAYVVPPPRFGERRKYANHLRLLELMMKSRLPETIANARSLEAVFRALIEFPSVGRFLAFQFAIDLNYSPVMNFGENDFVVPGPGSLDGIHKCFGTGAAGIEADVIRYMVDNQEIHFGRLGLEFEGLFGRRLQLVDCQNLFCEVDKYARIAHPDVRGLSGRTRIKQKFAGDLNLLPAPYFPPKWELDLPHKQRTAGRVVTDPSLVAKVAAG